MSVDKVLGDIPVVVERRKPSKKLHWQRRIFQISVLAALLLIPITGLFRIDPIQGAFVVLGRQIWFSDFSIVFGFWAMFACLLVMLYSFLGTVFCGWACPQNTLSEMANNLTYKLLGKRADISLDGSDMKIAPSKKKLLNWLVLGLILAVVALVMALIPLFYFYEPGLIWKFVTFQYDAGLAPSLHWIYMIFFLVIFVDITMIRHFMCRFMCIYKVWQHTFKTRDTLHVAYDESRSDECTKCNYCHTSCFLGIDPRKTDIYDTCINCGECITACDTLHARKGQGESLLKFAVGERQGEDFDTFKTNKNNLASRLTWVLPILLFAVAMFGGGIWNYERYHIAVYRAEIHQSQMLVYRISVANKFYQATELSLEVEGLPEGSYTLASNMAHFDSAGRMNVELQISSDLEKGLYPFLVRASSADGWQDSFRVHHLAVGSV